MESNSDSDSEDEMDNRSFQEENLEIDSEMLANALSDCDISNIENKIEFLKKLVLNQNKDYFRETVLPSKIENGPIKTHEMSLYLKQNLKTSISNNLIKEILGKENMTIKNDSVKANRSKFAAKKKVVREQLQNTLKINKKTES